MKRVVALFLLAACGDHIVDPPLPDSAVRFDPPAVYARWWEMAQECSGVRRDLRDVKWYRSPNRTVPLDGNQVTAYWSLGSNRIVVVDDYRLDGPVVRHEMLHALIRVEGHPRDQFVEKCGGVVHCAIGCIESADPSPSQVTPPIVEPSELDVSVVVDPAEPRAGFEDGFFSVTVTVTNPANHAVNVNVRPRPPGNFLVTYSLTVQGDGQGLSRAITAIDPGETIFQAHQTKRQVFDFRIDPSRSEGIAPGPYRITGAYAGKVTVPVQVTLGPN
jgi:hypothetical protein